MQNQDELCIFLPPASPLGIGEPHSCLGRRSCAPGSGRGMGRPKSRFRHPCASALPKVHVHIALREPNVLTRPLYRGNSTTGTLGCRSRSAILTAPSAILAGLLAAARPELPFWQGFALARTLLGCGSRSSAAPFDSATPPPHGRPGAAAVSSTRYRRCPKCWRRPIRSRSTMNSRSSAACPPSRGSGDDDLPPPRAPGQRHHPQDESPLMDKHEFLKAAAMSVDATARARKEAAATEQTSCL